MFIRSYVSEATLTVIGPPEEAVAVVRKLLDSYSGTESCDRITEYGVCFDDGVHVGEDMVTPDFMEGIPPDGTTALYLRGGDEGTVWSTYAAMRRQSADAYVFSLFGSTERIDRAVEDALSLTSRGK